MLAQQWQSTGFFHRNFEGKAWRIVFMLVLLGHPMTICTYIYILYNVYIYIHIYIPVDCLLLCSRGDYNDIIQPHRKTSLARQSPPQTMDTCQCFETFRFPFPVQKRSSFVLDFLTSRIEYHSIIFCCDSFSDRCDMIVIYDSCKLMEDRLSCKSSTQLL